jgi:dienelactone hydrolase
VTGVLQFSGALPVSMLGLSSWPADTPVQLHYATADPFRSDDWISPFVDDVRASGSSLETFLDYPGGHLFTDPSRPDEYDRDGAERAFERALDFLDRLDRRP